MDEVLKRRLVGAATLISTVLLVSWLLPSPKDAPLVESGQTTVTFDLTQPEIAQLPPAKPAAPVPPPPQTTAEPVTEPIRPSLTALTEPDEVQPPEQDPDRQSFLAAKPRIVESPADAEDPVYAAPAAPVTAPVKPSEKLVAPAPEQAAAAATSKPPSPSPRTPITAKPVERPVKAPAAVTAPKSAAPKPVVTQKAATPPPAVPRPALPTSKPVAPVAAARFFVQVGSFTEIEGARKTQGQLKSQSHKSLISPADTPAGTRYRVRVGPYPSREAAVAARDALVSKGYTSPTVVED